MFIPIGGVIIIGGCNSRACMVNRIIVGIFNLVMGAITIALGYSLGLLFIKIIGYIIAGMALFMIIANLFGLARPNVQPKH